MNIFSVKINTCTKLTTVGLCLAASFYFVATTAWAAPNPQINYQGKLTSAANVAVADGTYQMVFKLYTAPTGGSPIWTETRSAGDEVTVTSGLFSVMLGSVTGLSGVDFNQALYLGVTIEADAEMSPRKILGTVPAAFEAFNANTVGGVASTSLVRNDQANTLSATTAATLFTIVQNGTGDIFNLFDGATKVFTVLDGGNVGLGSSTPSSKLTVNGGAFIGGNLTATGTLTIAGTSTLATTSINNLTLVQALLASSGGTGLSTITQNQLLIGGAGNTWTQVATSSLGLGNNTFLGLTDTPGSYTASAIPFATSTANQLIFSSKFSFDGQHQGVGGILKSFSAASTTLGASISIDAYAASDGTSNRGAELLMNSRGTSLVSTGVSWTGINGNFTTTDKRLAQITMVRSTTDNAAPSGNVQFSTMGGGVFAERMRITASGTIGIGEVAPSYGLEIKTTGTAGLFGLSSATAGDILAVTAAGNVGVGSSSPAAKLSVAGTFRATGTSTLSDLTLTGALRDSTASAGTLGMVLQSTGTSSRWVATSTLGLSGGGSSLFTDGGATTYLTSVTDNLALGTTTATSRLSVAGDIDIVDTTAGYKLGGNRILYASTTNFSTVVGIGAGASLLTTGSNNTAVGYQAQYLNTSGSSNTALGYRSLYNNATGTNNTAVGDRALYGNTTGSYNVALGYQSLYNNATGTNNTANGYATLYTNTSGNNNTAVGDRSLYYNTTGSYNVALGYRSLYNNATGTNNTANGYSSLYSNTSGSDNTAVGDRALYTNTTGDSNTAIGLSAARALTTGYSNVFVGVNAGRYLSGGATANETTYRSIYLGEGTQASADGVNNEIVLGYNAIGNGTNSVTLGNTSITKTILRGNVGIGTTTPSAKLTVEGAADTALLSLANSTNAKQASFYTGTSSPDGRVTAAIGSLYIDTGTAALYQNTNGANSWNPFTQGTTTHMAKMNRNAAQSIPNITDTKVAFDNIEFDTGGIADATTNDRFDIKKDGRYLITASLGFNNLDGGESLQVMIYKNGSMVGLRDQTSPNTNWYINQAITEVLSLVAGDYIEMYIYQGEGASQNTLTAIDEKPKMSVVELAPTGGGNSLFTDAGANSYLSSTTDNLLLGTTTNAGAAKFVIQQQGAADILNVFDGATEVFTILDGGNVGIGTTTPSAKLTVVGTASFATSSFSGYVGVGDLTPDVLLDVEGTIGGDYLTTITNLSTSGYGLYVYANANNTTNRSFQVDSAAGELLSVVSNGNVGIGTTTPSTKLAVAGTFLATGASTLLGDLSINTTNTDPAANNVVGAYLGTSGFASFNRSANPAMNLGRSNDGAVLQFYSAGAIQGSVSIAGATVSYNAFTGSHFGVTGGVSYDMGTVLALTGETASYNNDQTSEILYGMTENTGENNPKVVGSYLAVLEPAYPESNANPSLVMAVGNGAMWVADQGRNIAQGDYLISSDIAGHAELDPQTADVSYVIARASENIDWDNVSTEINGVKHKRITVFFENFDRPNIVLAAIASSTYDVMALTAETPTERFLSGLLGSLVTWFGNAQNGIGSMYANVFNASELICVDGECLSADDIRSLKGALQGGGSSNPPPPTPPDNEAPPGDESDSLGDDNEGVGVGVEDDPGSEPEAQPPPVVEPEISPPAPESPPEPSPGPEATP